MSHVVWFAITKTIAKQNLLWYGEEKPDRDILIFQKMVFKLSKNCQIKITILFTFYNWFPPAADGVGGIGPPLCYDFL